MNAREGFFQAASDLVENPLIDDSVIARVNDVRQWFGDYLEVPGRFSRSKSKSFYQKETKGLSWFKPTAIEHLSKAHELKAILEEFGYTIEIIKSDRIGYVVYEDDHQVVAEPFADTAK